MSRMLKAAIIIASDKAYRGERPDLCAPIIENKLKEIALVSGVYILPDEKDMLAAKMKELSTDADIIITSGGTGLGSRDITPEATVEVAQRLIPGISEAIRAYGMKKTPMAMLSRGVAAVCDGALIINLPGSPKAADECLEPILPVLLHAVQTIKSECSECARD